MKREELVSYEKIYSLYEFNDEKTKSFHITKNKLFFNSSRVTHISKIKHSH